MAKFVGLTAKTYSYLKDNTMKIKKQKTQLEVCHEKKT